MELLVFLLVILLGNSLLPVYLPWWIFIPFNLLSSLPFRLSSAEAFTWGGSASGLVWLSWSYWQSHQNQHILAGRLSGVLGLSNSLLLFALEFFIPFMLGGVACMTGIQFKNFKKANA